MNTNNTNYINVSTNSQEEVSGKTTPIFNVSEVQRKLILDKLDKESFKTCLLFNFGTYKNAARIAGWTDDSRIHQIANGIKVPSSVDEIKRLSACWHIDLVLLTQLFSKLSGASQ